MSKKLSSHPSLILAGILFGVLLLRVGHFWAPTFRDEGIFSYVGQEVLRGYLPFETVFENKGVFLFYQLAAALAAFGFGSIAGVRMLATLWILIATSFYFYLLKDQFDLKVAAWGTGLLSFHWTLGGLQGNYYGSEMFAIPLVMIAFFFAWKGSLGASRWWNPTLAGVFVSLAVWTRLTSATFVITLGLFLAFYSAQDKIKNTLLYCFGGIAASVPFIAIYAASGKLYLLLEAYVLFSGIQASATGVHASFLGQFAPLLDRLSTSGPIILLGLTIVPFTPWYRERAGIFWFMQLGAALLAFGATGHYLIKQMHQFFPPLFALMAWSLVCFQQQSRQKQLTANLVIGASIACSLWFNMPNYYRVSSGDYSSCQPMLVHSEKVAKWIRENTEPDDEIYNWGVEWELYFRAERRSPVRQINTLAIVLTAIAAQQGAPVKEQLKQYQAEVYSSLQAHPPRILVTTASLTTGGLEDYYLPPLIEQFVLDHYDLRFKEGEFWVFQLKKHDAQPPGTKAREGARSQRPKSGSC